MEYEEKQVLEHLKLRPNVFVSIKEISRDLDRKRFREEPCWARRALFDLALKGLLERNDMGHYRYVPKQPDGPAAGVKKV